MKKQPPAKKNQRKLSGKNSTDNLYADRRKMIRWIGVIVVISFICFASALKNDLVNWDDYAYIRDNQAIRTLSPDNISHIFNYKTFIAGNYHPLTILSYAIEYKVAGLRPFLYHFDNIILHLLNVILFAWMIWLLTKKINATVISAALFAVHPMRVESVVWAAERKDVLYTFFFLSALICYILYSVKSGYQVRYYISSLIFLLLSLLSKGQAVVLPLTLFLIDYWYKRQFGTKQVLEKIPFFILSLLFGLIAIQAQASSLTVQRLISHTPVERIIFAFYNLTAYIYKLIFPYNLSCFYSYPATGKMWIIYSGAVITLILIALVLLRYRKNQTVMFGILFYIFTVSIVLQLIPVGNAIIADRYTYIPYIGLFFIIGILLDKLITQFPRWKKPVTVIILLQLLIFAGVSAAQTLTWKNNETLWKHVISLNPKEGMAYNNLAGSYMESGDLEKAQGLLLTGTLYKENYPEYYKIYNNLGSYYFRKGNNIKALQYFDTAVSLEPKFSNTKFNRGLTYTNLEKYDEAISDFTSLINSNGNKNPDWYYSRGNAYKKMNLIDSAIADYGRAIQLKPDYYGAYTNLGNIFANTGDMDKAINNYNLALKYASDKDKGLTYHNRSIVYFRKKDYRQALSDAETALSLKEHVTPDYFRSIKAGLAETGKR